MRRSRPVFVKSVISTVTIASSIAAVLCYVYFNIKDTKGPRERRFFIRASFVALAGIFSIVCLDCYVLHGSLAMKVVIGLLSFWSFFRLKRMQRQIRELEGNA
jgi:predicted Abi (CAAX) family protease